MWVQEKGEQPVLGTRNQDSGLRIQDSGLRNQDLKRQVCLATEQSDHKDCSNGGLDFASCEGGGCVVATEQGDHESRDDHKGQPIGQFSISIEFTR